MQCIVFIVIKLFWAACSNKIEIKYVFESIIKLRGAKNYNKLLNNTISSTYLP